MDLHCDLLHWCSTDYGVQNFFHSVRRADANRIAQANLVTTHLAEYFGDLHFWSSDALQEPCYARTHMSNRYRIDASFKWTLLALQSVFDQK